MSRWSPYASGFAAVLRRDASLYFAYRFRVVSQAALALFSLTLFYYLSRLVSSARFPTPDAYFAYVVVGLVVLHSLTATLVTVPNAIRTELVAGTFERLVVSPLGPVLGLCAMAAFPSIVALVTGMVTLALAAGIFGLPLNGVRSLLALPVALLAMLAFLPLALLVSALVLRSKQAGSVGNLTVVGLSLAGGIYFPPALMPSWISWVSEVQPFTPALDLLRHLLVGAPTSAGPWGDALRLGGFAVVLLPVGLWVLQASVTSCQRRGTLMEY